MENKIEKIITTGPPHSMHLIGLGLKKKMKLTWIADFRDPWTLYGDLIDDYHISKRNYKKYQSLEAKVVAKADKILATSKYMKDRLMPFDHDKFHTITNGYDEEDFSSFKDTSDPSKLVIYHAGMIYKERNPSALWQCLDQYLKSPSYYDNTTLHLVGKIDGVVRSSLSTYPRLQKSIRLEDYKSHDEVIDDYAKASVLLLLVNNSENALANIPGKLFEYLATGKPIIAVCPCNSTVADILKNHPAALVVGYEEASTTLCQKLEKFLEVDIKSYKMDRSLFIAYSRKNLTIELSNLLAKH